MIIFNEGAQLATAVFSGAILQIFYFSWFRYTLFYGSGGAVAFGLVGLNPAGDIVLCSWERHFALTVPLYTQV